MTILSLTSPELTWRQMIAIEPRLKQVYSEIKSVKDDKTKPSFCALDRWYGYGHWRYRGFKDRMHKLAGFYAADSRLRTMQAYDLAYDKLLNALPDCRKCLCCALGESI